MKNNVNLLLAAVFMIGFLAFWEAFVMRRYRTAPPSAQRPPISSSNLNQPAVPTPTSGEKSTPSIDQEDKVVVLETKDTKVSILSRGARVASWQIKERDHWIELVEPEKHRTVSPLQTFPQLNFAINKSSDREASFQTTGPSGEKIIKTLRLLPAPQPHELTLMISNPTGSEIAMQTELPLGNGVDKHEVGTPYGKNEERAAMAETRAAAFSGAVKSWKPGFIFQRNINTTEQGPFEWLGVDNHHFLMAFVAVDGSIEQARVLADRDHSPVAAIPVSAVLKPGETWKKSFGLYAGPKDYSALKEQGHNLAQAADFGFFGPIAKILLWGLRFFKDLTGNFGWAIILLTFCIQILVFPLTKKNLQHALRMKELQPHLKKLQEQYKKDPKRLQVETFNFYKKNGMKFMGMEGCFPMLLQIPVFFAFYSTLNVAYELRGAPWIFWIRDLGVYDPYYVLPIIMGVGMFLQQKLTMVSVDPAQARMMMFMPVMMTIFFVKLPAGLVLYWCVNSLTTILIQQFLGSHKHANPKPAT